METILNQCRIVAALDALPAEADAPKRLQAESRQCLRAPLADLRPAILDKAFKGEL